MKSNDDAALKGSATDSSIDYATVSYINSSRYRRIAVEELSEAPGTPSAIESRTEAGIAHISRALSDLRDRGVVELLVPDSQKKGRIYGLTDDGHDVAGDLDSVLSGGE